MFKSLPLPYNPVKEFAPVAYTHVVPLLLAVHSSVPTKNVTELVAWIKANPDKASYASSGPGCPHCEALDDVSRAAIGR